MQKLKEMFQMLEESHKIDRTNLASPPRLELITEMLSNKKEPKLYDDEFMLITLYALFIYIFF